MKNKILLAGLTGCLLLASNLFAADLSISEDKARQKQNDTNQKAADTQATLFVKNLQDILQTGSVNDALALFAEMPASLQNDFDLQKLHLSFLISAGKFSEAQQLIAGLEEINSGDIELKEMKMYLAKASGNKAAKSAVLKEIIAIDPDNSQANTELGQEQVLRKKYKPARMYYMKALKGDPDNQDALFGYGQTSYYLNELDDARTAFDKMLKIDPENDMAYAYIGKLYAEDGNYKKAEEYILKAITINSDSYDYYMDLGTYSRFRGKYSEAEKAWTKAINIDPKYFLAYAYRAGLYDEQNMYEKALNDYRMVVQTNPKYYFAYESLGILAWRTENFDEARAAFEKAYTYYPQNISYPLIIAACMYKAKKSVQVKPFLQKAMKNYPDHDSLEYLMLRLYNDFGPRNAENLILQKIGREDNSTKKGKMNYYLGLYFELKGLTETSGKIYGEVAALQSPMFFEYRLAEWAIGK